MSNQEQTDSVRLIEPQGEDPPRPTYAPAALALATMFTIWGILTHWTMSLAGLALLVWALGAWIQEVRHEWRTG